MRTNIQQAREALGAHLRQLRRETRLSGRDLASRLGWPPSKISKLELGQQTPTAGDLSQWVEAVGRPEAAKQLREELAALETFYAEWRSRLRSGLRFRQQEALSIEDKARKFRVFNTQYVPGILQTPEYARHILAKNARQHNAPDDVTEAVAIRMRRQDALYRPGKEFHFVLSESVLWSQAAAPAEVMAAQLDRLVAATVIGSTVRLGVIPFTVQWPIFIDHGFWIIDDDFVLVETLAAELRLTRPDEIEAYANAFAQLSRTAAYGQLARALLTRALLNLGNEADPATGG